MGGGGDGDSRGGYSGADIACALGVALLLVAFALCVWPGVARVRPADLEGNWAARDGALYQIRAASGGARAVLITGGGRVATAELHGVRGIRVTSAEGQSPLAGATPPVTEGRVTLTGNISWSRGDTWLPQGARRRGASFLRRGRD